MQREAVGKTILQRKQSWSLLAGTGSSCLFSTPMVLFIY